MCSGFIHKPSYRYEYVLQATNVTGGSAEIWTTSRPVFVVASVIYRWRKQKQRLGLLDNRSNNIQKRRVHLKGYHV